MNDRFQHSTVLVVEDEPVLRMLAVDMVEDAGYVALEAEDATEAVAILEARRDIAIVFTDVDMPGPMNGADLATCVRKRWPPIHVIVTSGHCTAGDLVLPDDSVFIQKPYVGAKVIAVMERMLH